MSYSLKEYYGEEVSSAVAEFRKTLAQPTDYRPVVLSKETYAALDTLLDYCWTTNFGDFGLLNSEGSEEHVLAAMIVVTDWMEQQPPYWVKLKHVLLVFSFVAGVVFFLPEIVWLVRLFLGWSRGI